MSLFDSTLSEIGHFFQISALAFNSAGSAVLALGDSDLLSFEKTGNGLVMSVARPLPPHRTGVLPKVMSLCAEPGETPFAIRPGLSGKGLLVLCVRFDESDFTVTESLRRLTLLREYLGKALET